VKIYVDNLAENVTESELRTAFEKYGEVESIELQRHQFGDKKRGYAYLDMPSEEDAMAAMKALYGHSIKGSAIKVNQARTGAVDRRTAPRGGRRLTDSPFV
jgi:RNA recognition motif-containing protein